MSKNSDFKKFLNEIEPSPTTKSYASKIQNNLRDYLLNHEEYGNKVIDTFLSGSYAKHTCIRPTKYDGKTDVDIVVVLNYEDTTDSKEVLDELYKVCKEKYKNVTKQSRSIGIEFSGIEVDVVPMIEDQDSEMLKIGNKDDGTWKVTNPKGHLEWCTETNKENNNEFVRIVKIFKWWRKNNCPDSRKYPKGITLEKIIADNLSDCNEDYEDIVYKTMKNIRDSIKASTDLGIKPFIEDPGVPLDNLAETYEFDDFKSFVNKLTSHINKLESNDFSNEVWREILGTEFPKAKNSLLESLALNNLFNVSHKEELKWKMIENICNIDVKIKCSDTNGNTINYNPDR